MREIDGYGGVEFGPFSLHLKDGDPNDLPINDVRAVIDEWTEVVQGNPRLLNRLPDTVVYGDQLPYVIQAPTLEDVRDRKIYIQILKNRAPQPQPMTFKFNFQTPFSRREGDTKKWWRRLIG